MHIIPSNEHLWRNVKFKESLKAIQQCRVNIILFHNLDFIQIHLMQIMLFILSYHA